MYSSTVACFAMAGMRPQLSGLLQRGKQGVEIVGVVVPRTVDVEGRRSVDAAAHAADEVLVDACGMDMLRELPLERVDIEPEPLGIAAEVLVAQATLVLVERVVHLPELPLARSRLGRLGCLLGVRVGRRDREVAKDESELLAHSRLDLFDDRVRRTAIRALVIAVLEEGHSGVGRTLDVIALRVDGNGQLGAPLRSAHEPSSSWRLSSAFRIPSAPGFTPTGET